MHSVRIYRGAAGGDTARLIKAGIVAKLAKSKLDNIKNMDTALMAQLAENCMLDDWTFSNPRKIDSPAQVMEILRSAL